MLCHSADQVLYVVRHDFASRNQVVDAMHSVTGRGQSWPALVINGRLTRAAAAMRYRLWPVWLWQIWLWEQIRLQQKRQPGGGAPRLGSLGQRLGDEDGAENLYFLTFLRDAVTGVCGPEAMALAKDMDRSAQDQVLELASSRTISSPFSPAAVQVCTSLEGWRRQRRWACTVEALVRQTMATQSLLTLTRALEQASVPALVIKGAVREACTRRRIYALLLMRTF
ncbi:MAG: hypothetical protein ACLU9S_24760 [Oscillospiraceae bacterium]